MAVVVEVARAVRLAGRNAAPVLHQPTRRSLHSARILVVLQQRRMPPLALDGRWSPILGTGLLLGEAALCFAIIHRIPYTPIDLPTFYQQVEHFLNGQREYAKIYGDTGPVVYAFAASGNRLLICAVEDTQRATSTSTACCTLPQTKVVTFARRSMSLPDCTWSPSPLSSFSFERRRFVLFFAQATEKTSAQMPVWSLFLLPLSKRLHSIYILRCFNDGLAMSFMYPCIYFATRQNWTLASLLFRSASCPVWVLD
jgi:alpha-1,3-mannosyltransferase